jgi:acetoin utilization deacetylase AcuC-like enzyme
MLCCSIVCSQCSRWHSLLCMAAAALPCRLLPILYEFAPHLIIVSAGFDAVSQRWMRMDA